ncbi:MAG: DNA topoisomerase VI subunit B, partial [Candidatus Heimdallarchaeota archaeon]|nr:DNA topoisomerase VI subunit B [Candidatus Heimdallarchaeota archaeon]
MDDSEKQSELDLEDEGIVIDNLPDKIEEKPPKGKKSKKKESKARTASAAVFFNENKSIAGFGNSMRAVFTSVRELVENSLDASENRSVTPNIQIKLRKLDKKELKVLMGSSVRKDKNTRLDFLELSCKDNGIGVPRELIPQLFGTVLAGTKYGAQQTRGRFGLGSKMVLLYAMSTLDLPIQITTRPLNEDVTYRVKLFINLEKNEPIINSDERFMPGDAEYFGDYGTEIKVSFTGSWNLAKLYVREYFKQLAIITPYADIRVSLPSDDPAEVSDEYFFQRVVDDLPKPPVVVKVHPWGTDISTFRREMSYSTEDTVTEFLVNNFMGVTEIAAIDFFKEVEVDRNKSPQDLTSQEIRRIVHDGFNRALKESKTIKRKRDRVFKFDDPEGDALSPLGSHRLRRGLEKELSPEFVEAITRPPRAYEGHPFIIEAAIGYGGGVGAATASKGVTVVDNRVIYRFANRIPLIFGAGSDLISNIVNSMKWSDYGLTRGTEPLSIAVSLVSTKIPFPETSKEYIDKVEEIGAEVKLTLMQLGRKLKTFLGRRRRRQRERQRKSRFELYAPKTVNNLLDILEKENLWNPTTGVSSARIITSLSSGQPRIDTSVFPRGERIFGSAIWCSDDTQKKLQEQNIHELATFLRTRNEKLAQTLDKTVREVDNIKRRTIIELDKNYDVPIIDVTRIMDPEVEKRFHHKDKLQKEINYNRTGKSLQRRWIRNYYDYLLSQPEAIVKVQDMAEKLVEQERYQIIRKYFNQPMEVDMAVELSGILDSGIFGDSDHQSQEKTQLLEAMNTLEAVFGTEEKITEKPDSPMETHSIEIPLVVNEKFELDVLSLLPPLELFLENDLISKKKVTEKIQFLFETTHPSASLNEKNLAPIIIPIFKANLANIVAISPELGEIKISIAGQKWIDGYLRNAFKRRKIDTLKDLAFAQDEGLVEIGELQRTLFSIFIASLKSDKTKLSADLMTDTHAKQKLKAWKSLGITSLEELAAQSA